MNYYVNGETGSDSNDGLSWENAFATIGKALEEAEYSTADNIYIEGNNESIVYNEKIEITKDASDWYVLPKIYFNGKEYQYALNKTRIRLIGINNPVCSFTGDYLLYAETTQFNHEFIGIVFDCTNLTDRVMYQQDFQSCLTFRSCRFDLIDNEVLLMYFWHYSTVIFDNCEINTNTTTWFNITTARYTAAGGILFKDCDINCDNSIGLYCRSYGLQVYFDNVSVSGEGKLLGNFVNAIHTYNLKFDDFTFERYTDNESFYRFSWFKNLINMGAYGNAEYGSAFMFKNLTIENNVTIYLKTIKVFENCLFLKETNDIFSRPDDESMINIKFKNCIFKAERPVNIDEEYFENCVFETNPLLDSNGVPTADSPCLPENWTGSEPIDTFIGWKDYYLEPSLSSFSIDGNKGDIDVSVIYTGYNDLNFNLEYSLDGSTWNQATIEYNENKELKGNNTGIINKILWKSNLDFLTDETTVQLRISGNDTINDSNTLISSEFTVLNEPILLVEPSISDLETTGTKGEIEISLDIFDEFSIVYGELQYLNNSNWYTCTLKYSNGNYFTASELGEENIVLWDSENDFSINLNTKIRARVTDSDYQTSDWVESLNFNVNNLYIPPVIDNLFLSSNTQDIEIRYEAQDDEYSILQTEVQYLDGEDWYSCTIDYNPALTSKSSFTGELNVLLWKSYEDIQSDLNTKLRIRVFDTKWSDWIETSEFSLLNGNIPPEVYWYSPLKFRLDEEEKIYFKLQKE